MRKFLAWMVLYYLRFWAWVALLVHRPYVIGIAGSVGKSSTRNALHAALKGLFRVGVVSGNSETGVPLGILGLPIEGYSKKSWFKILLYCPLHIFNLRKFQYLIVEMGVDDPFPPKNMSYLLTILKPDMAVDLNATATHTMQFEKLLKQNTKDPINFLIKKIAEEDSKIVTNNYTKVGIYNGDDAVLKSVIEKNANRSVVTLLTFGKGSDNTVRFEDYQISTKKTKFTYSVPSKRGNISVSVSLKGVLLPKASFESFASVLLVSYALGLNYSQVIEGIEKHFSVPKGRSTLFEGIKDTLIIDSSYNSSKSTVLSFLEMLKKLKEQTKRPVVFVMGDMRELGNEAEEEHEEVARAIVPIVNELHCVGPQTLEYVVPIVKKEFENSRTRRVEWFKNAVQAGLYLKENVTPGSIILVKGSQNTIYLEEAIKFLLKNPSDVRNLTRQEEYWIKEKQAFFNIQ